MSEKSRTLADLSIGQSGYVRIVNGDGCRRNSNIITNELDNTK